MRHCALRSISVVTRRAVADAPGRRAAGLVGARRSPQALHSPPPVQHARDRRGLSQRRAHMHVQATKRQMAAQTGVGGRSRTCDAGRAKLRRRECRLEQLGGWRARRGLERVPAALVLYYHHRVHPGGVGEAGRSLLARARVCTLAAAVQGGGGGRACVPAGACRGWRVGWGTLLEPARPNASAGPGTGAAARRSAAECRGVWRGGLRAPCGGPSPAAMFGMLEAGASGGCATPRTRAATRGAAHVLRALRRGGGGGKAAWADSHESAQGAREAGADADVRGARECPPAPRGAHRAPLGGRTRLHFRVCSRARGCVQPRARRL